MDKALGLIQRFIEQQIGIDAQGMSEESWKKALNERLSLTGAVDLFSYYKLLQNSPYEYQELIELIIVPETWFFRDRNAFDILVDYIKAYRKKQQTDQKIFRILSIPCSSGEEPYSIAMALSDAGIPATCFRIDAIDISKKALAKAERGAYGKNSFRGRNIEFRERYFDCNYANNLYTLKKPIRDLVDFMYGNICDQKLLRGKMRYDVIFCRSILIYFNQNAQFAALKNLENWLNDEGVLIISAAEIEIAKRAGFSSKGHGKAIAMYKNIAAAVNQTKKGVVPKEAVLKQAAAPEKLPDLKEVKQLADKGQFDQAEKMCNLFIEKHGFDAEAYFLLGLIEHAKKQEDKAEEFFSKAVYLNPNHYEALYYLALLSEKRGNIQQGELYRERAKRVQIK